jgi:hypothetical protein
VIRIYAKHSPCNDHRSAGAYGVYTRVLRIRFCASCPLLVRRDTDPLAPRGPVFASPRLMNRSSWTAWARQRASATIASAGEVDVDVCLTELRLRSCARARSSNRAIRRCLLPLSGDEGSPTDSVDGARLRMRAELARARRIVDLSRSLGRRGIGAPSKMRHRHKTPHHGLPAPSLRGALQASSYGSHDAYKREVPRAKYHQ